MQALVPFPCASCKTARTMLKIELPASARLAIVLVLILNCMWIEAIFVGHNEVAEDCFVVCPDDMWLVRRFVAMMFASILSSPALRILYVAHTQGSAHARGRGWVCSLQSVLTRYVFMVIMWYWCLAC